METGEFAFIRRLIGRLPNDNRLSVGPGDDCAVLPGGERPLLLTTDILTEGVDFYLAEAGAKAVGRKAMGANLSDIAAMAGVPTAALLGVVLPEDGSNGLADELLEGCLELANEFQVSLAGGDTNSWQGGLVISITILGEVGPTGAVTRSGAKPGDWLFVTGPTGGSLLGRHLQPRPRIREALQLAATVPIHAMIDISDGLAADLGHILERSGCGAVVESERVPTHADAVTMAERSGRTPLDHALNDGEDFELIFAVSAADGERLIREQPVPGVTLHKFGECVTDGYWLQTGRERVPLEPKGWAHRFSD